MHNIAQGMRGLHARGVLHRDLKAANVLVEIYSGDLSDRKFLETDFFDVVLADFESSMLVQGTGFWRAPEVLQELLKQPWDRNPQMWTEKVDVYSYAMTCYEVLTGHLAFYGYFKSDWQRVIGKE
jgi:serine/threonine protein kinase